MTKKKKVMLLVAGIFMLIFTGVFIYLSDYYRALPDTDNIEAERVNGNLVLEGNKTTGIIIYPGGKVDEKAYLALADLLADKGYPVVIAKMPFHLSILNNHKAGKIIEKYPEIEEWVLVGHSLGGTSASMYVSKYPGKVAGIVFLGSYPYRDLSGFDGFVLSITGSNDLVLNKEKAADAGHYYPEHAEFETIDGGNHAGFGCYGPQKGDGGAEITWQEQHQQVVRMILKSIEDKD